MSSPLSPEASKSLQSNSSFKVEEQDVRRAAEHHSFYLMWLNCYAAVFVFCFHLISWSTLFSCTLGVTFTLYTYYETIDRVDRFNGNSMSWILLSFAVVTPIGSAISMAFRRRENALQSLSTLRSTFLQLYTSHAIWGWDYTPGDALVNGRTKVRIYSQSDAFHVQSIRHSDTNFTNSLPTICSLKSIGCTNPISPCGRFCPYAKI
jgi:hypothetical protein